MKYPTDFPVAFQGSIESARDVAEIALLNALADEKADRLDEAYLFIVHVFRAFAHQACEAERQGVWGGAEGRQGVEWFLEWELIPHAYELARVSTFWPAPPFLNPPLGLKEFSLRVREHIKKSDVWLEYLAERSKAIGKALPSDNSIPDKPPESAETTAATPETRRASVEDFLERCNREYQGLDKLLKKDVWTLARHKTATQFQRWQRCDKKATSADNKAFRSILQMTPDAFIKAVALKRKALP